MSWHDGHLTKAVIHSKSDLPCRVVYGDQALGIENHRREILYPHARTKGCPAPAAGKCDSVGKDLSNQ